MLYKKHTNNNIPANNKLSADDLRSLSSNIATKTESVVNTTKAKVQEDISQLKNTVKQKANEVTNTVKVKADEVTNTAKVKADEVSNKANDIAMKAKSAANSYSFDFENHELELNNNVYDYTLLRHGIDLLTFGKATAIEQLCAAGQDIYGATKSLYLKDAPEALRQLGDAVWHTAIAAGTYKVGEYLKDKNFASEQLNNFVDVSNETLDTIYTGAKTLGGFAVLGGLIDTYYNAEHIA